MASYARRFVTAGVRLVGGCCGTTPEHTRQMRVAATAPTRRRARPARACDGVRAAAPAPVVAPVPRAEKSRLASALARGQFVLGRGARSAARARDAGVRRARPPAADSRRRRAAGHRSAGQPGADGAARRGAAARAAGRHRDRAAVPLPRAPAGGDAGRAARRARPRPAQHPAGDRRAGRGGADYPDATALVEADSIGVTNAVSRLNHGTDLGGQPIGEPTAFHTGVRVSPSSLDLDEEVRRYRYKAEAGAEFAMTEPIFDVADVTHFRTRARGRRRCRSSSRSGRWAACARPSGWPTRCRASGCRRRWSSGCARRRPPGPRPPKGWPSPRSWPRRCGPFAQGIVVSGPVRTSSFR